MWILLQLLLSSTLDRVFTALPLLPTEREREREREKQREKEREKETS